MAVEDRRTAIVAAAVPLFLEGGVAVTTREIAHAAGIAEGTIFRAFVDKGELVEAVIAAALDPAPAEKALAAIDLDLPLAERLTAAVDILRERVVTYAKVMAVAEAIRPGPMGKGPKPPERHPRLEALLAPDADRLRSTPVEGARLLRGLTVTSVHPSFQPGAPPPSAEIVDLFLHGIAAPTAPEDR